MTDPRYPLLMEPQTLQPLLGQSGILLVDLCQTRQYPLAHIPGAIHVPFSRLMSGQPPAVGQPPSLKALNHLMCQIGLNEQTHVIAYDDEGGGWAGRFLWTLDLLGHSAWSYLNGGLHAWLSEYRPIETAIQNPIPSDFQANLDSATSASQSQILTQLKQDDFVLWDARTPQEYLGLQPTALRNGHIPGAINYEWLRALDPRNGLRIRHLDDIQNEFNAIGLTPDKDIVTYCHAHHRSGFTYLLGRILGFPRIRAYPGAWSEWGNSPDVPIETQPRPIT